MKFTLFATFLFSIGWMSVEVTGVGRPVDCCTDVSNTKLPVENIVHYSIQNEALCSIRAVRFQTKRNKVVCSNPDSDWAKRAMKIVDWRKTTTPSPKPTCYTSTTNVILTVKTTKKTPGTETESSTSTTVTPSVTSITTPGPETSTSKTTVTTIETSRTETKISKTTIPPTSVSTDNPESTVITCATPKETRHETPGIGAVTPLNTFTPKDNASHNNRTKPSKLKINILKKRKKLLRKHQMNLKNKSG